MAGFPINTEGGENIITNSPKVILSTINEENFEKCGLSEFLCSGWTTKIKPHSMSVIFSNFH